MDVCECVHGMNFRNIYWRIESLHQPTLIHILYEFFIGVSTMLVLENRQYFMQNCIKKEIRIEIFKNMYCSFSEKSISLEKNITCLAVIYNNGMGIIFYCCDKRIHD